MHEVSLCEDLIEQLETLAVQHGAVGVAAFELEVGRLSGAEPDLLRLAFAVASKGTVAESAALTVQLVEPLIICHACGREAVTPPHRLGCPACGSLDTRLVAGDALVLRRVELITNGETGHV